MKFTDQELQRLKEEIAKYGYDGEDYFFVENFVALIARLEAAEAVIKEFRIPEDMPVACVEKWLASKGEK